MSNQIQPEIQPRFTKKTLDYIDEYKKDLKNPIKKPPHRIYTVMKWTMWIAMTAWILYLTKYTIWAFNEVVYYLGEFFVWLFG